MENLSTITAFLGWCTLLNIGLLTFSTIMISLLNTPIKSIHAKITGVSIEKLDELYFAFLGNYKLAIFVFNLVPYCALKLMT